MSTYLYCIRSEGDATAAGLAGLVGVDGASVRTIHAAGLSAWVSELPAPVEPTVDRVKAHDAVCAAAMTTGETPLPVRFGQTFDDDAAAESAIAARHAALRERLSRVAGCVELRVVVTRGRETDVNERSPSDEIAPDPHAAEAARVGPGTAFLERLARAGRADLAREIGCEEVRHAVRNAARSLVVEQQRCESARGMAFFPVLVRRSDVVAFQSAVANSLSSQGIELAVLGPFAPYSFAGDA